MTTGGGRLSRSPPYVQSFRLGLHRICRSVHYCEVKWTKEQNHEWQQHKSWQCHISCSGMMVIFARILRSINNCSYANYAVLQCNTDSKHILDETAAAT